MTRAEQIEQLALGELSPEEGAKLVRLMAEKEELHEELYLALRSCVWKALDSRRRDAELNAWMEVVSRAASRFADKLSSRLEGFVELLQISSMVAEVERRRDPLEGKHTRKMLVILRKVGKPIAKKRLMEVMRLKGSTLTQAIAPLLDRGWVKRETIGREVQYRLTLEGLSVINQREPEAPDPETMMKRLRLARKYRRLTKADVIASGRAKAMQPSLVVSFSPIEEAEELYLSSSLSGASDASIIIDSSAKVREPA